MPLPGVRQRLNHRGETAGPEPRRLMTVPFPFARLTEQSDARQPLRARHTHSSPREMAFVTA